jgi:hypothetical protein
MTKSVLIIAIGLFLAFSVATGHCDELVLITPLVNYISVPVVSVQTPLSKR